MISNLPIELAYMTPIVPPSPALGKNQAADNLALPGPQDDTTNHLSVIGRLNAQLALQQREH